ncbi:MAG TPA: CoA-binding protein [Anaeromyxobacteraceae bacterium]
MSRMRERAREILAGGRIALVGVSSDPRSFSRAVLRELLKRGHDVAPVSTSAAEAEGRACAPRVQDLSPPPSGAIVMTPPARTADAVRDCLAAGVRRIWLHRGAGPGAASPEAIAVCRDAGVEPVTDLCPFMALPRAGWFHRLHGFLREPRAR